MSKHYAVIGHPIGHTMSPFIHKRLFELAGVDADYTQLDIAPESLEKEFHQSLAKLDGYNITIPHKQSIIPFLDELDEKAKMYGSVNTVLNRGGKTKGFTTDPDGFLKAIDAAGIKLDGRIMILGCGGVARTMAYEIALMGKPFEFAVRRESVGKAGLPNATSSRSTTARSAGARMSLTRSTIRTKQPSSSAQRQTAQGLRAVCPCSSGRRSSRMSTGTARHMTRRISTGSARTPRRSFWEGKS